MSEDKKETELDRQLAGMAVAQKRAAEDRRKLPRTLLGGDWIFAGSENIKEVELEIEDLTEDAAKLAAKGRDVLQVASKPKPKKPPAEVIKAKPPRLELPEHYQSRKHPSGIAASLENTLLAIAELGVVARYDEFHNKVLFDGHVELRDGEFETVCLVVRRMITHRKQFEPTKDMVIDAVNIIAQDNRFNPILDWFATLKWDGKKRIDTWLTDYCGAENNALNRAIGRKFLIAAVRRVKQPGCKFDNIIVLEGKQGTLKSTLARALAGGRENFSDADILQSDKREQQELCEGVWIYEIAELSGLHKSEVEKVKAFASRQEDKARPAFARKVQVRQRTCVFFGTTNDNEYLQDQTGNRRFWPVAIVRVDIDAFRRDREQLFAEALVAEATGEPLVLPEEVWPDAEQRQESRVAADPWADRLGMLRDEDDLIAFARESVNNIQVHPNESNLLCWRVSSEFILSSLLNIPPERQNNAQAKKVANIMRKFGWALKDFKFAGKVGKGYWRVCRDQL
jgi:predicted P-loop ATPase